MNEIKKSYGILEEITKSGYIPFSSPSPSSTEEMIKDSIIEAMRLLDRANYLHVQCYGADPVAHVC